MSAPIAGGTEPPVANPKATDAVSDLTLAKHRPAGPITWLAGDADVPQDGIGLALSGGGTRAMLFHAGSLLRLYELGVLAGVTRISGVSGGSIAAGVLALAWRRLVDDPRTDDVTSLFHELVIEPLRAFARQRVDVPGWVLGTLLPFTSPIKRLTGALDAHLYHGARLADLPQQPPLFVFNSTNLATGVLWRFTRPYMADYRLGRIFEPDLPLAVAVAASSAFPPFFSPLELRLNPADYRDDRPAQDAIAAEDLARFRSRPRLADGGVYDNLGLETVWKSYRDVLVSDGGGGYADDPRPPRDLVLQTVRVMKTIDRQVRALRRNILIDSYKQPQIASSNAWRRGAYWGVRTRIGDYSLDQTLPCPADQTSRLAAVPTRLNKMDDLTQERLINWGYAVTDAAVRAYYRKEAPPPDGFPFPTAGVG